MSTKGTWARLAGDWAGTNRLWLTPQEPVRESETTASVAVAGQGRFVTIRYTWADRGQPQDGVVVVGLAEPAAPIEAAWIDSWHMGAKIMLCRGESSQDAGLTVAGAYAAPPGPDWGWRIELQPEEGDELRMRMVNISPDGQEDLAVEASYQRRP